MPEHSQLGHEAIEWAAANLDAACLYQFLRSLGSGAASLFKGFKISRDTVDKPLFRQRLANSLIRHPQFLDRFLGYPDTPWQQWHCTLQCLDEAWLHRHWRPLLRASASPALVLALALDERDGLRARGLRLGSRKAVCATIASFQTQLPEPISQALAPLLALAPSQQTAVNAPHTTAPPEPPARPQEIKQLTESRDRAKKRAREAEDELKALRQQRDDELRDLRRAIRTLQQDKDEVLAHREQAIHQRLNRFRHDTLGVDRELLGLKRRLQETDVKPLLHRVQDALQQQTKLNEKHGLLADVRAEIAELDQALNRVDASLCESVVILPELESLRRDLQDRLDEWRALPQLGQGPMPELASCLLSQINRATDSDQGHEQLDNLQHALRLDPIRQALGRHWTHELRQALADKEQALTDLLKEKRLAQTASAAESNLAGTSPKEVWNVALDLDRTDPAHPVHLLIDGYNLTKTVGHFQNLENQLGLPAVRDELARLCKHAANRFGQLEIVYDGDSAITTHDTDGPIAIVYAPKLHDSQNADNYIVKKARTLAAEHHVVWVVTVDYGLRARLLGTCQAFISTDDFFDFLKRT